MSIAAAKVSAERNEIHLEQSVEVRALFIFFSQLKFIFQFISESDILQVVKQLTKNELTLDDHTKITEKVIEEGDIDSGELENALMCQMMMLTFHLLDEL